MTSDFGRVTTWHNIEKNFLHTQLTKWLPISEEWQQFLLLLELLLLTKWLPISEEWQLILPGVNFPSKRDEMTSDFGRVTTNTELFLLLWGHSLRRNDFRFRKSDNSVSFLFFRHCRRLDEMTSDFGRVTTHTPGTHRPVKVGTKWLPISEEWQHFIKHGSPLPLWRNDFRFRKSDNIFVYRIFRVRFQIDEMTSDFGRVTTIRRLRPACPFPTKWLPISEEWQQSFQKPLLTRAK